MPQLTVAIVTARNVDDTHYHRWVDTRRLFLNRQIKSKYLNGEFGALLAAVLDEKLDYHVEYQIRALEKGTRVPDRIIVIDRARPDLNGMEYYGNDGKSIIARPMVSSKELEMLPGSALCCSLDGRSNKVSMGCNDKNTAIALCETEYLLMLDDCCLPGFGLVEAAYNACEDDNILLVSHQQMYFNGEDLEVAQANWCDGRCVHTLDQAANLRRVFGVWAMRLSHALAVNGFNTALDGDRGGLDLELLERMDRYVKAIGIKYETNEMARIYEIGHEHPWAANKETCSDDEWRKNLPDGWQFKAPGMSLKDIRKNAGVVVGGDIFGLADHAELVEREEVIGDIIDELSLDDE